MKKLIMMTLMLLPIWAWSQNDFNLKPQKITAEVSENGMNCAQANPCIIAKGTDYVVNTLIIPEILFKGTTIVSYGICISQPDWIDFKKGNAIIIKLITGEIIEGKASSDAIHEALDYTGVDPLAYLKYTRTMYVFSNEDVSKLRTNGIAKIRQTDGVKYYDRNIPTDASRQLIDGFKFLDNYVLSKPGLYDDF